MQHRVSFPLGRSAPALARVLALALCLSLGALTCSFSGAAVAAEPEREFLDAARNGELASLRRLIDEDGESDHGQLGRPHCSNGGRFFR